MKSGRDSPDLIQLEILLVLKKIKYSRVLCINVGKQYAPKHFELPLLTTKSAIMELDHFDDTKELTYALQLIFWK